jgi:hypothetical protein
VENSAYGIAQSVFAVVGSRLCCAQNACNMFVSYHRTPSLFVDFAISFAINDGGSRTGVDIPINFEIKRVFRHFGETGGLPYTLSWEAAPVIRMTGSANGLISFSQLGHPYLVLIQKNGDYEVEASFTEHEVASFNASGLTYGNIEWKQQPDFRRK